MRKSTLLAIIILLVIIASYRLEKRIHEKLWQQLSGESKSGNTLQINVTKEEYKHLMQWRRDTHRCGCSIHIYGIS